MKPATCPAVATGLNISYNRPQETIIAQSLALREQRHWMGMVLYFKNKRPKTFLGAPVGWPLMFLMAVDLCIAGLMFLSDHDWSGLVLLYPPIALAFAMLADARREKEQREAREQAQKRRR